jgi:hypothetical protein
VTASPTLACSRLWGLCDAGRWAGPASRRTTSSPGSTGIWGLGQLARQAPAQAAPLVALLGDDDPEIRAQAAKTLGDVRYPPAAEDLIPMLRAPADRVRFFTTEALGRIAHGPAVQPLVTSRTDSPSGMGHRLGVRSSGMCRLEVRS